MISGEDLPAEEKHPMLQRPFRKKKMSGIPLCFSLDFWRGSAGRVEQPGSRQTQNQPAKKKAGVPPCVSMDFGGGSAGKGEKSGSQREANSQQKRFVAGSLLASKRSQYQPNGTFFQTSLLVSADFPGP